MMDKPQPPGLAEFLALAKAHVQAQEDSEAGSARWCWSIDQEEYFDAATEAQAHADAIDRLESDALEEGEERAYWIARQKPAEAYLALRWLGESIVDRLVELLEDDIGGDDPPELLSVDGGYVEHAMGCHRDGFEHLWTSINGLGSWHANPWVWVVEFRCVDAGQQKG